MARGSEFMSVSLAIVETQGIKWLEIRVFHDGQARGAVKPATGQHDRRFAVALHPGILRRVT
jgi:hypothetical protein